MFRHGYHPQFLFPFSLPFDFLLWLRVLKQPDLSYETKAIGDGLKGLLIVAEKGRRPDVVVYYLHGGGFAMGSPYFYLEFLMAWATMLRDGTGNGNDTTLPHPQPDWKAGPPPQTQKRFRNPAVFALDYTLVPTATFPTQLQQILVGYGFALSLLKPPRAVQMSPNIVLAGDSAGGTLALSLILLLASSPPQQARSRPLPSLTTLISPWCRLVSPRNRDTESDYLNADSLHEYARQYAGATTASAKNGSAGTFADPIKNEVNMVRSSCSSSNIAAARRVMQRQQQSAGESLANGSNSTGAAGTANPLASPGDCASAAVWRRACPAEGYHVLFGSEEVLGQEVRGLLGRIREAGVGGGKQSGTLEGRSHSEVLDVHRETSGGKDVIKVTEKQAGIHAWPVVSLFLGEDTAERLEGLREVAGFVAERLLG